MKNAERQWCLRMKRNEEDWRWPTATLSFFSVCLLPVTFLLFLHLLQSSYLLHLQTTGIDRLLVVISSFPSIFLSLTYSFALFQSRCNSFLSWPEVSDNSRVWLLKMSLYANGLPDEAMNQSWNVGPFQPGPPSQVGGSFSVFKVTLSGPRPLPSGEVQVW